MSKYPLSLPKYNLIVGVFTLALAFASTSSFAQTGTGLSTSSVQSDTLAGAANITSKQKARALFLQAKKYHDGVGVSKDYAKAYELYLQSASLGENDARLNLGFMYFMGEGTKQDYRKAKNWYLSAARTGSREAQLNLVHMFANGLGVEKNPEQANYWRTYSTQIKAEPRVLDPVPVPVKSKIWGSKPLVSQVASNIGKTSLKEKSGQKDAFKHPLKVPNDQPRQKFDETKIVLDKTLKTKVAKPRVNAHKQPSVSVPIKTTNTVNVTPLMLDDTNTLPVWISSLLALSLFGCAVVSGFWFMRQWQELEKLRMNRVFADTFYAHHRPMLRTSYLKYPEHLKRYSHIDDRWVVTLSVLMVKFANENSLEKGGLGRQSRKILSELQDSPLNARKFVFPLIPHIQPKILDDIFAVDCSKQVKAKSFQFTHPKKITNVVKLHGLTKNIKTPFASNSKKFDKVPPKSLWPDNSSSHHPDKVF